MYPVPKPFEILVVDKLTVPKAKILLLDEVGVIDKVKIVLRPPPEVVTIVED
jgi:hypothetical protein